MSAQLAIHHTGNGPALLLLHGWALHKGVFNPLVERLAKQFSVYTVDLPGYGFSRNTPALQLPALVSAIAKATPPAIWCGWSMGGVLALQAAHVLPSSVRALIMLAATPCFVRAQQWLDAMEPATFSQFRQGLTDNTARTLERFLALNVKGSMDARKALRYLHQVLNQTPLPDFNTLNQGLDWLQHGDLRALLPELNRASLWIGGEQDHLIPAQALYQAAALVESALAQVHILPGCAHVPFIDQPDMVAQLICDFVHVPTV